MRPQSPPVRLQRQALLARRELSVLVRRQSSLLTFVGTVDVGASPFVPAPFSVAPSVVRVGPDKLFGYNGFLSETDGSRLSSRYMRETISNRTLPFHAC